MDSSEGACNRPHILLAGTRPLKMTVHSRRTDRQRIEDFIDRHHIAAIGNVATILLEDHLQFIQIPVTER